MMTVANLLGLWEGEAPTTLMQSCRDDWNIPIQELSDLMVATFLSQQIATSWMVIEAKRRLSLEQRDDTEYFDGQLAEALQNSGK